MADLPLPTSRIKPHVTFAEGTKSPRSSHYRRSARSTTRGVAKATRLSKGDRVSVSASLFKGENEGEFDGNITKEFVGRRFGIAFDDGTYEVFDDKYISKL